ncbi:hypothetical protein ACJX0J_039983, partial [Zea mays]
NVSNHTKKKTIKQIATETSNLNPNVEKKNTCVYSAWMLLLFSHKIVYLAIAAYLQLISAEVGITRIFGFIHGDKLNFFCEAFGSNMREDVVEKPTISIAQSTCALVLQQQRPQKAGHVHYTQQHIDQLDYTLNVFEKALIVLLAGAQHSEYNINIFYMLLTREILDTFNFPHGRVRPLATHVIALLSTVGLSAILQVEHKDLAHLPDWDIVPSSAASSKQQLLDFLVGGIWIFFHAYFMWKFSNILKANLYPDSITSHVDMVRNGPDDTSIFTGAKDDTQVIFS